MRPGRCRLFSFVVGLPKNGWILGNGVISVLSQIIGGEVPINTILLLLDADYFWLQNYKILLAYLLTFTYIIIASQGLEITRSIWPKEWISNIRFTCLLSKMFVLSSNRTGVEKAMTICLSLGSFCKFWICGSATKCEGKSQQFFWWYEYMQYRWQFM